MWTYMGSKNFVCNMTINTSRHLFYFILLYFYLFIFFSISSEFLVGLDLSTNYIYLNIFMRTESYRLERNLEIFYFKRHLLWETAMYRYSSNQLMKHQCYSTWSVYNTFTWWCWNVDEKKKSFYPAYVHVHANKIHASNI